MKNKLFAAVFGLLLLATPVVAQLSGGLIFPGPGTPASSGGVPIGTPLTLGTGTTTASSNTVAMTGGVNIVAGDLVVVAVANNNSLTVSSISDGTNSYTKVTASTANGANNNLVELWYKENASAVTGPTITATMSATGTSSRAIAAARVTGIITSSSLNTSQHGQTSGGSCTAATGTLAQTNEILFASATANSTTVTVASGFTQLSNPAISAFTMDLEYKIVAATTSTTFAPGTGTSGTGCVVGSFKGN